MYMYTCSREQGSDRLEEAGTVTRVRERVSVAFFDCTDLGTFGNFQSICGIHVHVHVHVQYMYMLRIFKCSNQAYKSQLPSTLRDFHASHIALMFLPASPHSSLVDLFLNVPVCISTPLAMQYLATAAAHLSTNSIHLSK